MCQTFISVDKQSTFPALLEVKVKDYLPHIRKYLKCIDELSQTEIRCAIDFHVFNTDAPLMELLNEVKGILSGSLIEGFHNTRLLRKAEVLNEGLQLLTAKSYFSRLCSVMTEVQIDENLQNKVCAKLQDFLDNKHGNRTNMISLFAPYRLCQEYSKFTENIGGEICEFGLSNDFPDVLSLLSCHGCPVTVKFLFPFADVIWYRKDNIAVEFIRHYSAKLLLNHEYCISFDAALINQVSPDRILDILDFGGESHN